MDIQREKRHGRGGQAVPFAVGEMSVYVDDMYALPMMGQFGRMKMSHLMADTTEELLAMADKIGVARRWLQHAGTPGEHFDIAMSKRALAVQHGAIPTTVVELAKWRIAKRRGERYEPQADGPTR